MTLADFLAEIKNPYSTPPAGETLSGMVERTSRPDAIHRIDRERFRYFLEVLPPKWTGSGAFAFSEDPEPWKLFWFQDGAFYCRQLTEEQTETFRRLAGTGWLIRSGITPPGERR